MARRQFAGGAVETTITGAVAGSGAVTVAIASSTGWPDASVGPFAIVVDPGTASEEKMLVTARTGLNLTVTSGNRGYDGTSATTHDAGATCYVTYTAVDFDEANSHVNAAAAAHNATAITFTPSGTIAATTVAAALAELDSEKATSSTVTALTGRVDAIEANDWVTSARIAADAVGSSEIAAGAVGTAELASAAVTAVKVGDGAVTEAKIDTGAVTEIKLGTGAVTSTKLGDGAVTAAKVNFTASTYTPAVYSSGIPGEVSVGTGGTAFKEGRYIIMGKLMWIQISVGFGSGASAGSSGEFTFGLPSGVTAAATREQNVTGKAYTSTGVKVGVATITASGTAFTVYPDATPLGPSSHGSFSAGTNIYVEGIMEIA